MKTKNKNLALFLSYFYLILNTLCGLISSSVVVRTLGPTDYGIYQIATSFTVFLSLLNFGTGTIMTRNLVACRINKKSSEEENISTLFWMTFFIFLIVLFACIVLFFLFDNIYSSSLTSAQIAEAKPIFLCASLNLSLSFISQTIRGIVHGNDDYTTPKLLSIGESVFRFLVIISLLRFFRNGLFISCLDLAIKIFGIIFLLCFCKKWYVFHKIFSIKKFRVSIFKSSFSFAVAMILQVFVNQSVTQLPKTIVGIALNPEAVTLFSVALYIYSMFSSVCTVPVSIFLPSAVHALEGKEKEQIDYSFLKFPCRINSLLGGMLLFGFFAFGKHFIALLYGKEQLSAWTLALIMLVPMYLNMLNAPCINVLNAQNKMFMRSVIITVSSALSLILCILFIKPFGLIAVASSIAFALLFGNTVAMSIYYKKVFNIPVVSLYLSSLKGILPSLIISSGIVFYLSEKLSFGFKNLFVLGLLFVLLLLICLLLFGFSKEEKTYIWSFVKKTLDRVKK